MNRVEDQIAAEISFGTGYVSKLEKIGDLSEELTNAQDLDEIKLDICATAKELYFANLKAILSKETAWTKKEAYNIDRKVTKVLYKSDMPYTQIIQCIAHSPRYQNIDTEGRWIMASTYVAKAINPLLTIPEVKFAKQLREYNLLDFKNENMGQIYMSYLKKILEDKPECSLYEADVKIVKALRKLRLEEKSVKEYLKFSPQFAQVDNLFCDKEKDSKLDEFLSGINKESQKVNGVLELEENETLHAMKERLTILKEEAKAGKINLRRYWENVNNFLKQMIRQADQAQIAAKILDQWINVMEKASEKFDIATDENFQKMKKNLNDFKNQGKYEDRWRFIADTAKMAATFADKMTQEIKARDNPLARIPEIVAAKKFSEISNVESAKTLYFSAAKYIINEQPKLDIIKINKAVVALFMQKKISDRKIAECLQYAPNLQEMSRAQQVIHIHKLLKESNKQKNERCK